MPPQVYALLVGINEYPAHVGRLSGCVNDVAHVDEYLRQRFDSTVLRIETLRDSDATRQNIIDQFRQHLSRATADDVVLFHYSGHGARWKSAREFQHLYPDGMDEGLVCANSRLPGEFDLADKELAILLHEVARNSPHLAVVLDCCHSGSATRTADDFTQLQARQTHEVSVERPLETYLDGYYAAQRERGAMLEIPNSRHVLMAACQRTQKAWEGKDRCGVFTSTLLDVLSRSDRAGSELTYADLFVRCRSAVRMRADNQDPQFETYRGFHAYQRFLEGNHAEGHRVRQRGRYTVTFEKQKWRLNCGAMHGLPADPEETVELALYGGPNDVQLIGRATTTQVGPQASDVTLSDLDADTAATYSAEITSLPVPPLEIGLEGNAEGLACLERCFEARDDRSQGFAFLSSGLVGTRYVITAEAGRYLLKCRDTGRVLQGAEGYSPASADYLFAVVKRIVEWERGVALQNHWTRMDATQVPFQLSALNDDDEVQQTYPDNDLVIDVVRESEGDDWSSFRGRLTSRNLTEQPLSLVLVYFSDDFGIQVLYSERVEPTADEFTITLDGETDFGLVLDEHEGDRAVHRFKLIVATEEIDHFLLAQEPLEIGHIFDPHAPTLEVSTATRGIRFGAARKKLIHKEEWFTQDLRLTLIRQIDRVSVDDVTLANGCITIKGHRTLQGAISLGAAGSAARDVVAGSSSATADFHQFLQRQGMELLNFAGTRGSVGNLLELTGLQWSESADIHPLATDPLEIELRVPLAADECILPLVFDGDDILLAGESSRVDADRTTIRIGHIPDIPDQRRGVGKSLRLYFFKTVLRQENVSQLRWVEYKPDGSLQLHEDGVAARVASATNILVLLHGILGDSAVLAGALPLAQDAAGTSIHKKFDLVLAYNFESLGTPIPITATQFQRQLKEAGIRDADGKRVTLLAHSIGGLVARWFIEQGAGKSVVDHLVMCGTPHSGSPISQVGAARSIALLLTTLAININPVLAVSGGLLASFLGGIERPTTTLEGLNPQSDLIKTLQSSDPPGIPYTLVKGDYHDSVTASQGALARIIAKVGGEAVLATIHRGQDHDIVASGSSLSGINPSWQPSPTIVSVACHHLNYFTAAVGLEVLARIDWGAAATPSNSDRIRKESPS